MLRFWIRTKNQKRRYTLHERKHTAGIDLTAHILFNIRFLIPLMQEKQFNSESIHHGLVIGTLFKWGASPLKQNIPVWLNTKN